MSRVKLKTLCDVKSDSLSKIIYIGKVQKENKIFMTPNVEVKGNESTCYQVQDNVTLKLRTILYGWTLYY